MLIEAIIITILFSFTLIYALITIRDVRKWGMKHDLSDKMAMGFVLSINLLFLGAGILGIIGGIILGK